MSSFETTSLSTEIFLGEILLNFTDILSFAKIFPANILLYYIALCLYIEGKVTQNFTRKNFNFKNFAQIFTRKDFSLYGTRQSPLQLISLQTCHNRSVSVMCNIYIYTVHMACSHLTVSFTILHCNYLYLLM